jgi:hypothetical protein
VSWLLLNLLVMKSCILFVCQSTCSRRSMICLFYFLHLMFCPVLFCAVLCCSVTVAGDIPAVRNLVSSDPSLLNQKMFGFEGHDVYGTVPESKSGRCYSYTGVEKDGFFFPLHVAAEMGHKKLVILLVQAGADQTRPDYRDELPEAKCNGTAAHAFYELRGLRFEAVDSYEGQYDRFGKRYRQGSLLHKDEGYFEELCLLYRGGWKDDLYSGHGSLYWPGSSTLRYLGRFKAGQFSGSGTLYSQEGERVYAGQFREGLKEGRGEEYSYSSREEEGGGGGRLVYKGDFSGGLRHGFGAVQMSEGHRYMGRLDKGVMTGGRRRRRRREEGGSDKASDLTCLSLSLCCALLSCYLCCDVLVTRVAGVGVYFHPGGNRFEGNFFNNKPVSHCPLPCHGCPTALLH